MSDKAPHVLGIIGVRDFNNVIYANYAYVEKTFLEFLTRHALFSPQIVTGGGKGVEALVFRVCEKHGIPFRKIPPNIKQYGEQKAFAVRNNAIISESSELLVYWDGKAPSIPDTLAHANILGRNITIYPLI